MTSSKSIIASFMLIVNTMLGADSKSPNRLVPENFPSYKKLNEWAHDCFGGGGGTKFLTVWEGKQVELCYTTRSFTSGVATTEITFWRPDKQGGWTKTVGTSVMNAEFKIVTSFGGCTLDAYDESTKSWIHWMTIATPVLCNGISR
jgi:hypothetical protein